MKPAESSRGLRLRELTASTSGGVSVLSLEGPGALDWARRLARRAGLEAAKLYFVSLYSVNDPGELLDEALVCVHAAEHVELHLHGAPILVQRLAQELDLQLAPRGEHLEARAWELASRAASDAAARVFLDQAEGALRRELERLLVVGVDQASVELARLIEASDSIAYLLRPPSVVLAGPVNAGKSTLFNLLVGEERVVTDAQQGTTRDLVGERIVLGQYAFDLVDTAGERELGSGREFLVEREGQYLAQRMRERADLVLWMAPSSDGEPAPAGSLRVASPGAGARMAGPDGLPVLDALGDPQGTRRVLAELLEERLVLPRDPWQAGRAILFDRDALDRAKQALAAKNGLREALESVLAR